MNFSPFAAVLSMAGAPFVNAHPTVLKPIHRSVEVMERFTKTSANCSGTRVQIGLRSLLKARPHVVGGV